MVSPSLLAQRVMSPPLLPTATLLACVMSPEALNSKAALARLLLTLAFKLILPPYKLMGPAIRMGLAMVKSATLDDLPHVKPEMVLAKV